MEAKKINKQKIHEKSAGVLLLCEKTINKHAIGVINLYFFTYFFFGFVVFNDNSATDIRHWIICAIRMVDGDGPGLEWLYSQRAKIDQPNFGGNSYNEFRKASCGTEMFARSKYIKSRPIQCALVNPPKIFNVLEMLRLQSSCFPQQLEPTPIHIPCSVRPPLS